MYEFIENKLREAFNPVRMAILDESDRHRGHAGARPEGESHFKVEIVSVAFNGKTRLERQRMIYAVVADAMATDIHALSLKALTPEEDAAS